MQQSAIQGFRLSPQQARLWCLQEGDSSSAYRAEGLISIEGPLDDSALREALGDVVHRHEILRTSFRLIPGMRFPLQVISASDEPLVHSFDLSTADPEKQRVELEALCRDAGRLPFDLEQGPLIYLALIRLSPIRHMLLLATPALCSDSTSLRNLTIEIARCYAARTGGSEQPDEPVQYADCAQWLNELLEATEGAIAEANSFWSRQDLQGISASHFSIHAASASGGGVAVRRYPVRLPSDLRRAVASCAAECGSSISLFLLACWQILLARSTDQSNVVVGWVRDGRTQHELQTAAGLFARHLPLQGELPHHLPFRELLQRLAQSCREADEWQDAFSAEILELDPGSLSPRFIPVCFEFEEPLGPLVTDGVSFSLIDRRACVDRFEVKLCGTQRADELTLELHYDRRAFGEAEIRHLGERLQTILRDAATRPDATIGDLEILGTAERRRVLVDFNQTKTSPLANHTVQDLFEQQAASSPSRTAVVCAGRHLTYAELNGRANRLARHLRRCGVGPEVPVGLQLTRSVDLAVGVLAVLKAGGAWVPLDPGYPEERLNFLVSDAGVQVLVSHEKLSQDFSARNARVVTIDPEGAAIPLEGDADHEREWDRATLAYVVYTSGSTGLPKGVMVTHANVSDYVQSIGRSLGITNADVYLHTASFGFSSAVRQLLVPLAHGARVVIATSDELREPVKLFQTVRDEGVTIIDLVPSFWRACAETLNQLPGDTRQDLLRNRLRLLLSASEPLPSEIARTWRSMAGWDAEMINMFGLTETTGIVASHAIEPRDEAAGKVVPIGRPLGHTRIHILDARLQPVPIGVVGEMYVAGQGVSRGYLRRPALTAEAFIPDALGHEPGSRMFRTGDRGRYLPDGSIEFIARSDHQLKIRGFRVEPAEIESVLREDPGVASAVVVGQDVGSGERRVVAYVVPRQPAPSVADLSQRVKRQLPAYMLPSAFVLLPALPLTPNGKIDRRALPRPENGLPARLEQFTPPRTPTEEVLVQIWAEVLGIEQVGVHDDIFALGGHSLIVTKAVSRIRRALAVELPIETVFDLPTVAQLGTAIDDLAAAHNLAEP
jgi:amino acid adenylation domain-containing protein